jgi:hypothetical protein
MTTSRAARRERPATHFDVGQRDLARRGHGVAARDHPMTECGRRRSPVRTRTAPQRASARRPLC